MDTYFEHSQTHTFHVQDCLALTRESGEGCTCWWIGIERLPEAKDAWFGPYPDQADARVAMEESLLIQAELDPPLGGYECWIEQASPTTTDEVDVILIDLNDPHHTGKDEPERAEEPETLAFRLAGAVGLLLSRSELTGPVVSLADYNGRDGWDVTLADGTHLEVLVRKKDS